MQRELHSSKQNPAGLNTTSGQEVAKKKGAVKSGGARLAKTDVRYWQAKLYHAPYTWNGEKRETTDWVARMQHLGRREIFPLGTPNKAAAAARARDVYLSLASAGWEATLARYKPKSGSMAESKLVVTVDEFIAEVKVTTTSRAKTIEDYCRSFRTIVAQIHGIDGGKEKFDYRTGGRQRWAARVGAIKLADMTPEAVQEWKRDFLRRAGNDPLKQRSARISCNSLLRQAKSLFSPATLKVVGIELRQSPFDGVAFEKRQSMRYHSGFAVESIVAAAQKELPQEEWKILLLASMAGLRRNEIDKLEWSAFRWSQGIIRIETTRFFKPKSEDSIGDVEIDSELLGLFRGFHKDRQGAFVIDSDVAPRNGATYSHYRCQRLFQHLTCWLRAHGVTGNNPLHSLRKEYGSQVCAQHGIYAASHALRHGDITITSQHYLDKKKRVTVGLGHLLHKPTNITEFPHKASA